METERAVSINWGGPFAGVHILRALLLFRYGIGAPDSGAPVVQTLPKGPTIRPKWSPIVLSAWGPVRVQFWKPQASLRLPQVFMVWGPVSGAAHKVPSRLNRSVSLEKMCISARALTQQSISL